MEDMLQAHRDLKGVFGINDDSALGALGVVDAAGRKDIVIVGFDATDEAQAAIRKGGPLKADVVQYPHKIGQTAIDIDLPTSIWPAKSRAARAVAIDVGIRRRAVTRPLP